jgi:glycosyltransferase involved in cell wall biosynthesis
MSHKLTLVLSGLFKIHGGIPRFNQMLCRALDELAPELDLQVTVLSQDDTFEDYRRRAPKPWAHLRFIPGGGQRTLTLRTLDHCYRERTEMLLIGLLGMTPVGLACLPVLPRGFGFIGHGVECWSEPRLSRRFAARRAAFAFTVSRDTGRCLARTTGMDPERIHWVPNTLEPDFEPARPEAAATRNGVELLTVARLWSEEKKKGVDHSLAAFARVQDRHPGARYRIVGKGSDRPRLEGIARRLGIADRVSFEQDLPDTELAEAYRSCDVFVLPSGQEGFGIVFLEAMKFAKPCIGGTVGGTPEVVLDEQTGLLVPFGDEQALAAALDRLMGDEVLRRRMGLAGLERLRSEFTFPRFRARLRGYLTELMEIA